VLTEAGQWLLREMFDATGPRGNETSSVPQNVALPTLAHSVRPKFRPEAVCCLLLCEALTIAQQAVGGSPPRVHRQLDLADALLKRGKELLEQNKPRFPESLMSTLTRISEETLPQLINEARCSLPKPDDDPDSKREGDEHFKKARHAAYAWQTQLKQDLERYPNLSRSIADLKSSSNRWMVIFDFESESDFNEYLDPSVRVLLRSDDPMQRDLFQRILAKPEFSLKDLTEEGYRRGLALDSINALLREDWAKWINTNSASTNEWVGVLTEAGRRVLRQMLDTI
jgi:hypothetical protein